MTIARDTSKIDWGSYFTYDEASPSGLVWNMPRCNNKIKAGQTAGSVRKNSGTLSYWAVEVGSTGYMVHRVIWEMLKGALGTEDNIDHEDGNGLNNKIENLLCKAHRSNCQNKKKQDNNTSGVTGVYFNLKKNRQGVPVAYWMASWIDGKSQRTKCFNIAKLGNVEAYNAAVNCRHIMIEQNNLSGMAYSVTHGKRE